MLFSFCLQASSNPTSLSSHGNGKKLRLSHLIATENWKPHPLLKNIPHLYEKNRGFYTPFWRLLATYLQFIYRNRPCKRKKSHVSDSKGNLKSFNALILRALNSLLKSPPFQGLKMRPCSLPWKIIPHLIGQKMGKIHPSLRIVYFLFTKIDSANKKCAFRRIKRRSGRFSPRPRWHMIWGGTLEPTPGIYKFSSSPKGRGKASAISCTPSRKP